MITFIIPHVLYMGILYSYEYQRVYGQYSKKYKSYNSVFFFVYLKLRYNSNVWAVVNFMLPEIVIVTIILNICTLMYSFLFILAIYTITQRL